MRTFEPRRVTQACTRRSSGTRSVFCIRRLHIFGAVVGAGVGVGVGVGHVPPPRPLKIAVTEQSGNVMEMNGRVVRCENVSGAAEGYTLNGVKPFGVRPGCSKSLVVECQPPVKKI